MELVSLLIVCLDSWLVSYSVTGLVNQSVSYAHAFVCPMLDANK